MQRSTHILVFGLAIVLGLVECAHGENKPSIATGEFLSVLAKNVATVLSPTLVGELQEGRPNRTVVNATLILPISGTIKSAKRQESTTEASKTFSLESDTVRSAQTQSEVRPGTSGFPYNFDDTYRFNYPGLNGQGFQGRPDFSGGGGGFINPAYFNPEIYRAYARQNGAIDGNAQRPEIATGGIGPAESLSDGQAGRSPDNLDPSPQNFERFRNYERFLFNSQFAGNPANGPLTSQRQQQDGRFGQSLVDPFNHNFPGNPNILGNPNFPNSQIYQNSILNNYPRNGFPSTIDPYQQRQQNLRSGNLDFLTSSQRLQNPLDNYPRSFQRGPAFPGFYPVPYLSGFNDPENSPLVPATKEQDPKKIEEAPSEVVSAKSGELLKNGNVTNSTDNNDNVRTENPEILSVQGRIRFGRLLLPTSLDDYDDLRFRPDDFREYLITPNNSTENKTKNDAANDI